MEGEYLIYFEEVGYSPGRTIFNNINISLKKNGIYFIIGPNGSGKSTFFSLLSNNEGIIFKKKEPLSEEFLKLKKFYFEMDIVKELSSEMDITFLEFIEVALEILEVENKASEVMKYASLAKKFRSLKINEPISNNSLGNVSIGYLLTGIVLSEYLEVVILDEPFAHLSIQNSLEILNLLSDCSKKTLILISSNIEIEFLEKLKVQGLLIITRKKIVKQYLWREFFDETSFRIAFEKKDKDKVIESLMRNNLSYEEEGDKKILVKGSFFDIKEYTENLKRDRVIISSVNTLSSYLYLRYFLEKKILEL